VKRSNRLHHALIGILALICLGAILFAIRYRDEFTVQAILEYTPGEPFLAAMIVLMLYALKSISIFFPTVVLQIAAGHLFPMGIALLINLLGILIILACPYFVGRCSGTEFVERLEQKHPKFRKWIALQEKNTFFLCFFLRVTSCLPSDLLGMYFGATRTPFWRYLIAGTLGILPGMIPATLIGDAITDPTSPMFIVSVVSTVVLSVLSAVWYYFYQKKHHLND